MGSARALWIGHFLPWLPGRFRQEQLEEVTTWQFRTRNGLGQGQYPPKRYVYNRKTVFASGKASTRNDEAYDAPFVRFDGKSKTAKKPTRQISKTVSVGFTEAKNRVRPNLQESFRNLQESYRNLQESCRNLQESYINL